ncbi:unnamed protein product [Euphydryas editha]|uniref:Tektin n=1 Tax=Euphydryas editha TaxID=104508 RepID=A0AAU9TMK3_EUPED|nr:unnamed protein product [Euphydryas editha]
MFSEEACLGTTCGIDKLRILNDELNAKVVEQINGSQELVMLASFARESNEYQFKKCLQNRISDVTSWRWVLEDLSKRLEDSVECLKYEHNALRVVVQRIKDELNYHSKEGTRPGAICPLTDIVEKFIMEEYEFLRIQKRNFENLILELDKQTYIIEKTKNKINNDVLNKIQSLTIDETCVRKDYNNVIVEDWKKNRKKGFTVACWTKHCEVLKKAGLKALCNAIITRQQIRGARVQLSFSAQAYSTRIDAVLRRRLCSNKIKIQDLEWQREEALRDYTSLEEELALAEKTLIGTMDQERVVEARLSDRTRRPNRELIKDEVNRKLRDEQLQLRKFAKELRNNITRIIKLKNDLSDAIAHIDCCAEDLMQVINLDEERIQSRQAEQNRSDSASTTSLPDHTHHSQEVSNQLTVIQEENEDDYPFEY